MRSSLGPLAGLLAGAFAASAGCAGAPPPPAPVKPKAAPVEVTAPSIVSPARWDYHPVPPDSSLGTAPQGARGCVLTAEGGQRWVSEGPAEGAAGETPGEQRCSGKAEASAFPAREELPGVVHRADGSWLFVGESGTLYLASEPLGAFSRTIPPPEPFARVSGAGGFVLAATYDGKVLHWDEAGGWRPSTVKPAAGRPSPRLFDVVVRSNGQALALGFPEVLFASDDGGGTFALLAAPPVGAQRLGRTQAGELALQGLFESLVLPAAKGAPLHSVPEALSSSGTTLDLSAGRGPSAGAVLVGRAVIDGDRYVEAVRPDSEGDAWSLAKGRIEGRLSTARLPDTGKCGNMQVALRGKHLAIACVFPEGDEIHVEVQESLDLGATFGPPLALRTPDTNQLTLAAAPNGDLLISGACRPPAPDAESECHPTAPLLARAEGDKLTAIGTSAPQLSALRIAPVFSVDGQSAYFVGRRGKDDAAALFVSHDGGASFSPRSLDLPGTKVVRRVRPDDDESEGEPEVVEDALELDESSALRPGEDGSIGLVMTRGRGPAYVLLDEDGRLDRASTPPVDEATIAGAGRHVIAFAFAEGREQVVRFWESPDGGASWEEQAASPALGRELSRTSVSPACSPSGCLFGELISRIGWGASNEPPADERPGPERPLPMPSSPSVLTPIVCELSPKVGWSRIDHPQAAGPTVTLLPDVDEVYRGRSAWSVLTEDPDGAVGTVSATFPENGEGEPTIVTRSLLGRKPAGESAADISRQMEGYAAVRVPISLDKDGDVKPGTQMRNVEVGWENYLESSLTRAKIPDAGPLEPPDVEGSSGERFLMTGLITVTARGIVVSPHSPRAKNHGSFFIDNTGKIERLALPDFPERGLAGGLDLRADAVAIDGQVLAAAMVHDRSGETTAVILACRDAGGGWTFTSTSILPAKGDDSPLLTHTDWTYAGKSTIGITALVADRMQGRGWATFQPFRADGTLGPAEPQPTLLDLGDRPRPCSAAERASSPRFESRLFNLLTEPLFPGQRHPVLVTEAPARPGALPETPLVLLTGAAVVHGSPSAPCVAAWEASGLARAPLAAVIGGDLKHAWLFRPSLPPSSVTARPGAPAPRAGMEHRPMVCRFDPAARVPDSVWAEPGIAAPER
ncbi:MAG: hypothetical protein U0359_33165 [Byssovorax sp.]